MALTKNSTTPTNSSYIKKSNKHRLGFLDVLRGVGALSVFIQHSAERLYPGFANFTTHYFQLGQFGVMLFFLCSGFIIPSSLLRLNSLRLFWINRFLRLYPLYWFSLFLALILSSFSIWELPQDFSKSALRSILANLTMLQALLNIPNVIPLYWSLAFEMLFYFLVSFLFFTRLDKYLLFNTSLLFLFALIIGVIPPLILAVTAPIGLVFNIATMFMGSVLYKKYNSELETKTVILLLFQALFTSFITLYANFWRKDDFSFGGTHSFLPMCSAWITAYLIFLFSINLHTKISFLSRQITGAFGRYLGKLSYSIYLMHPLIIVIIPEMVEPLFTFLIWFLILIFVAQLTYSFIEKPFINYSHKIASQKRSLLLENSKGGS